MERDIRYEIGKMRSLIERMESNLTPRQALLNESVNITESVNGARRVLKAEDFYDKITGIGGRWKTTFCYMNGVNFLSTGQKVNFDDFSSAVDSDEDLDDSVKDSFGKFVSGGNTRKNAFPYAGIVKTAVYNVNWQSAESHKEKYGKFVNDSDELAAKYGAMALKRQGLPLNPDVLDKLYVKSRKQRDQESLDSGKEIKPRKDHKVFKSYGKGGMWVRDNDFDKNGNNRVVIPQDMKGLNRGSVKYYLINQDGSIAGGKPVSYNILKNVITHSKSAKGKVNALRELGANDEEIERYLEEFNALGYAEFDFLADSMLYIIGASELDDREKFYFWNNELVEKLTSNKKEFSINPGDFQEIARQSLADSGINVS